jgi:hypothetical protein
MRLSFCSMISPVMHDALGRQIARAISYPVSPSDIRRWAIATYSPHPAPSRFLGEGGPDRPLVAPEDFNPFAWLAYESDGVDLAKEAADDPDCIEHSLGIDGPGLSTVLNGSLEIEYGVPIRSGDVVASASTLESYQERNASRGPMLLTTVRSRWTNQGGEFVKQIRNTIIRL